MIVILDTNFLVKYFTASSDLGMSSKEIFEDKNTFLIIPSIVLVELKYLIVKSRIPKEIATSTKILLEAGNCMVYPLDQNLINYIHESLNIHDGIIYATAVLQTESFKEEIYILTKDKEIKDLAKSPIKVVW